MTGDTANTRESGGGWALASQPIAYVDPRNVPHTPSLAFRLGGAAYSKWGEFLSLSKRANDSRYCSLFLTPRLPVLRGNHKENLGFLWHLVSSASSCILW